MKRMLAFIGTGILLCGLIIAQPAETITNNSIIKMVKANLSDELIIDVIRSSTVDFDLTDKAVKSLTSERVSDEVLEAMIIAGQTRTINNKPTESIVETLQSPPTVEKVKPATGHALSPQVVQALGYTAPLKQLVTFYEDEFKSMHSKVADWDQMIRNSLQEADRLNAEINQQEADLRAKKNADANAYSKEILAMKKKLSELRAKYRKLKENMIADAEKITKELSAMGSDKAKAVNKRYDEVGQLVKTSYPDPGKGENAVPVTFTPLAIREDLTANVAPAAEMFYWHQNEMDEIRRIIEDWNPKIREMVQKDAALMKQLEPIQEKLGEYKADPKKYKTEIAALKKQSNELEKERKALAEKTETDSKELAGYLKEASTKIQESLEERISDIIENINYFYREKLHI